MSNYSGLPIGYGPKLPPSANLSSGTLFYKTEADVGGQPGLYIYRFKQDIGAAVGDQVGSAWEQVSSLDVYVNQGGDKMSGPLTLTTDNSLVLNSPAPGILIAESDATSGNKSWFMTADASTFQLQLRTDGVLYTASTALAAGNPALEGTFATFPSLSSTVFSITRTGVGLLNGGTIWHSLNDGAASGLDADLLDGQHGSYYTNLANSSGNLDINTRTTGTLAVARGGTNSTTTTVGGVLYGATTTQISTSTAGTSGQLLRSNGTAAPTWVSQSAIVAGSATVLATARTISLAGDATGSVSFNGSANVTITTVVNNASTADTLTTARSITLAGDVTGTTSFNGSANVTITTTVADDSHNHTGYVLKAGDTMTGSLGVGSFIALTAGTGNISASTGTFSGNVSATGYNSSGFPITNVGAPTAGTDAATKDYADSVGVPPGTVLAWAGQPGIPAGYFECNGASLVRTSYPELFAAIGTTYGAASGTTFNVPDLRGQFIRGYDSGGAIDPGRVYGSYQQDAIQYHKHWSGWAESGGASFGQSAVYGAWGSGDSDGDNYMFKTSSGVTDGYGNPNSEAGLSLMTSETRPKNIAMRFIIKY